MTGWLAPPLGALLLLSGSCGGSGDSTTPRDPGPNGKPSSPLPVPNSAPLPAPTNLSCAKGTYLTYENFGEAFMLSYCLSCHSVHLAGAARSGAPLGQDFDTAASVAVWRQAIITDTLADAPKMPPAANVSAADKGALGEWLNCGAPSASGKSRLP